MQVDPSQQRLCSVLGGFLDAIPDTKGVLRACIPYRVLGQYRSVPWRRIASWRPTSTADTSKAAKAIPERAHLYDIEISGVVESIAGIRASLADAGFPVVGDVTVHGSAACPRWPTVAMHRVSVTFVAYREAPGAPRKMMVESSEARSSLDALLAAIVPWKVDSVSPFYEVDEQ